MAGKTSKEPDLDTLRAELEVAEAAVETAPEEVREQAEASKAAAEAALREAHLSKVEQEDRVEKRPAKEASEKRALTLQELNQSASTQNVRGTHELTPEEHAQRRNPSR